jgi:uridylate kinase
MSTDEPAMRTAIDARADAVIMCKFGVYGVHEADPQLDATAPVIPRIAVHEALERNLQVMDRRALELARDARKIIHVIPAAEAYGLRHLLEGKEIGSVIEPA